MLLEFLYWSTNKYLFLDFLYQTKILRLYFIYLSFCLEGILKYYCDSYKLSCQMFMITWMLKALYSLLSHTYFDISRSKIQGLGLYAARDLEKHTMVIEYIGEIIRTELAECREKQYEAKVSSVDKLILDRLLRPWFLESRHLYVQIGRGASCGRHSLRRLGPVHQPLLQPELCRGNRRGGKGR